MLSSWFKSGDISEEQFRDANQLRPNFRETRLLGLIGPHKSGLEYRITISPVIIKANMIKTVPMTESPDQLVLRESIKSERDDG